MTLRMTVALHEANSAVAKAVYGPLGLGHGHVTLARLPAGTKALLGGDQGRYLGVLLDGGKREIRSDIAGAMQRYVLDVPGMNVVRLSMGRMDSIGAIFPGDDYVSRAAYGNVGRDEGLICWGNTGVNSANIEAALEAFFASSFNDHLVSAPALDKIRPGGHGRAMERYRNAHNEWERNRRAEAERARKCPVAAPWPPAVLTREGTVAWVDLFHGGPGNKAEALRVLRSLPPGPIDAYVAANVPGCGGMTDLLAVLDGWVNNADAAVAAAMETWDAKNPEPQPPEEPTGGGVPAAAAFYGGTWRESAGPLTGFAGDKIFERLLPWTPFVMVHTPVTAMGDPSLDKCNLVLILGNPVESPPLLVVPVLRGKYVADKVREAVFPAGVKVTL